MTDPVAEARALVQDLDRAVAADRIGHDRDLWGGAGLGVVTAMPTGRYDTSVRYVVTPHAASVSWIIRALWKACQPLLDSMTRVEFFGRLGNAADRYHQRAGEEARERDLLGAVLHEAYEILSDIENGRFFALPVAQAGVVYDDLLPESAHTDALTGVDFEHWFNRGGIDGET